MKRTSFLTPNEHSVSNSQKFRGTYKQRLSGFSSFKLKENEKKKHTHTHTQIITYNNVN